MVEKVALSLVTIERWVSYKRSYKSQTYQAECLLGLLNYQDSVSNMNHDGR